MIEQYTQLIPMIYDSLFEKSSVALYNHEQFLEIKNGKRITLPFKAGDFLWEGSAAYDSIHKGVMVKKEVAEEAKGTAYYSIAYPIKDKHEIIGGMAIAVPLDMLNADHKLQHMSHELASSMEQMSAAIQNIANSAQLLAENGAGVAESSQEIHNKAEEMEEVVEYINSVASDTKLLGLNASIEAARAGEMGRGFGVVATEIRNMATSSLDSSKNISKFIHGIRQNIDDMTDEITKFGDNTQEISAALQEITASIESLTQTAEELEVISANI